jgi:hypothetical protein
MADTRPPPSGGERDPRQNTQRLGIAEILQFVGALLVSIGLGSLVNRLRKRSSMSDSDERPQRHVAGSRRRDIPKEPRRDDEIAPSDVAKEQAAKAEEDAALEAKRAIGHEPSDVRLGRLVLIGVVIAVIGALTGVALYGMFVFLLARPPAAQPPSELGNTQPSPPAPRLQTDPVADWQALQATQEATLHSYSWADRGAGKVRIPIDRAIDLLTQRGLPVEPGSTRQFNDRTPNLDSSGGQEPAATPTPGG